MNTLQSFWNFFLNTSLLDNTLDVTNEKKKSFFSFMRCGLRILQLQKRFFMLLLFNVQLFIFFDAINRSISLRAKLYFTIWKLQHITLVREKSPKIPHLFSSISPYQDSLFGLQITRSNFDTKRHTLEKKNDWHISKSTQAYCSSVD